MTNKHISSYPKDWRASVILIVEQLEIIVFYAALAKQGIKAFGLF